MKNTDFPHKFHSFAELLRSFTEIVPSRPALKYEKGGVSASMSRSAFTAAVRERADELRSYDRTCLGVLCDGSISCVVTIFASVITGMQTVLLDETADETLLQDQLRETDVDLLWSNDEDLVEELTPFLTDGIASLRAEIRSRGSKEAEGSNILFFTSGTTASSKAVVLTDSNLMAAAYNGSRMIPLSPNDILICMLPLNHVFGFVCGLLWGMECDTPVALGRGARYYMQDFMFYKPTVLPAVPLLLSFLMQHKLMNSELRLVLVGAGDCPQQLFNTIVQQGVQISFGYGLTETSSGIALSVPDDPSSDPYAMEICPEDTVTLAPDGEILVATRSCMMKGYYKHPEDTEAVLREGVLHTGDLGKWDEKGRLHVIGRKKEILVLSDGTKIFLPEYEARIAAALPGRDFTVFDQNGKPALLIVDKESSTWPDVMVELSRSVIQENLKKTMAELPRGQQLGAILFTDHPLPRTATGKVKRWELLHSRHGS